MLKQTSTDYVMHSTIYLLNQMKNFKVFKINGRKVFSTTFKMTHSAFLGRSAFDPLLMVIPMMVLESGHNVKVFEESFSTSTLMALEHFSMYEMYLWFFALMKQMNSEYSFQNNVYY